MSPKARVVIAIVALTLAACSSSQSNGPVMPADHRAGNSAPADSTTMRGPGMMGGGG
jgi:type IV pilus biogenesis protein CpaD/CtpE